MSLLEITRGIDGNLGLWIGRWGIALTRHYKFAWWPWQIENDYFVVFWHWLWFNFGRIKNKRYRRRLG